MLDSINRVNIKDLTFEAPKKPEFSLNPDYYLTENRVNMMRIDIETSLRFSVLEVRMISESTFKILTGEFASVLEGQRLDARISAIVSQLGAIQTQPGEYYFMRLAANTKLLYPNEYEQIYQSNKELIDLRTDEARSEGTETNFFSDAIDHEFFARILNRSEVYTHTDELWIKGIEMLKRQLTRPTRLQTLSDIRTAARLKAIAPERFTQLGLNKKDFQGIIKPVMDECKLPTSPISELMDLLLSMKMLDAQKVEITDEGLKFTPAAPDFTEKELELPLRRNF